MFQRFEQLPRNDLAVEAFTNGPVGVHAHPTAIIIRQAAQKNHPFLSSFRTAIGSAGDEARSFSSESGGRYASSIAGRFDDFDSSAASLEQRCDAENTRLIKRFDILHFA